MVPLARASPTTHSIAGGRAPDAADYRSPPTAADGVGTTDYLGIERVFYEPTERGSEAGQASRLDEMRERRRTRREDEGPR